MRTAVLMSLTILLLGLSSWGCSDSKSGRIALPNQPSNFTVTNKDNETLHVYVDGGEIGKLAPGQTVKFHVNAGTRRVQFREKGDALRTVQGEFIFNETTVVSLIHDPAVTINLRVRNQGIDTIHVLVALQERGEVKPGETRELLIESGRWDVHLRRTGSSFADFFGTFNFNTSGVVEVVTN